MQRITEIFWFIVTILAAIIVIAFLFLCAQVLLWSCLNYMENTWGGEAFQQSYTAVCPCRGALEPKVILMDARSHDDRDALRMIAWYARHDADCWGCKRGFPRIFDCHTMFHVQRFLEDDYRVIYFGGEE